MKSIHTRMWARTVALAGLVAVFAACDDLLTVENPQEIPIEDLEDALLLDVLTNGQQAQRQSSPASSPVRIEFCAFSVVFGRFFLPPSGSQGITHHLRNDRRDRIEFQRPLHLLHSFTHSSSARQEGPVPVVGSHIPRA